MKYIETEEEKRLEKLVYPYLDEHAELSKDAPKEVVEAFKRLYEITLEHWQS